jgi:hypothetical protein
MRVANQSVDVTGQSAAATHTLDFTCKLQQLCTRFTLRLIHLVLMSDQPPWPQMHLERGRKPSVIAPDHLPHLSSVNRRIPAITIIDVELHHHASRLSLHPNLSLLFYG